MRWQIQLIRDFSYWTRLLLAPYYSTFTLSPKSAKCPENTGVIPKKLELLNMLKSLNWRVIIKPSQEVNGQSVETLVSESVLFLKKV